MCAASTYGQPPYSDHLMTSGPFNTWQQNEVSNDPSASSGADSTPAAAESIKKQASSTSGREREMERAAEREGDAIDDG